MRVYTHSQLENYEINTNKTGHLQQILQHEGNISLISENICKIITKMESPDEDNNYDELDVDKIYVSVK
jgi:hypothetical protein